MSQILLENGKSWGLNRGIINANFTELYTNKLEASQVLTRTNTSAYTPTLPYHPATKQYADALQTNWDTVFNPQDISGDVFLRSNHTGSLTPSVITQDSSNRFVTDSQITLWTSKEPAIGAKGTGFNKDFGTIAGTVAEGNHMHTKADVGLGNVDNTSDINKPVSTAQQTAIDAKLNKTTADFTSQVSYPSYLEGRTFYSEADHSLVTFTDITGVAHVHGQGDHIRFINKTGVTIPKGAACRQDGVDTTTSLPKVQLAIATSTYNARVLGVTNSSVLNNAEGFLSITGNVDGFDTSAYTVGLPIYLSDTIPGGYTNSIPDFVTQVGGTLISNATTGRIIVSIINNISLPSVLGIMQTTTATYTMTGTGSYETLDSFSVYDSVSMSINATTGEFTLPNDGWYRATLNVNLHSSEDPPSGIDTINIKLRNTTQSTDNGSTTVQIPSAAAAGDIFSRNASFPFYAIAGDVMEFQIGSADHTGTLTFDSSSFDIESITTVG